MTEFMGLDIEYAFEEHYHEVLDMFDGLFVFIFTELQKRYAHELEVVKAQFPFEDFQFLQKTLRLEYKDGVKMLRDAGYEIGDFEDLRYFSLIGIGIFSFSQHRKGKSSWSPRQGKVWN